MKVHFGAPGQSLIFHKQVELPVIMMATLQEKLFATADGAPERMIMIQQ
mgnify:CR=1 FL=1